MTPKEKAAELVDNFMKYKPVKLSDYTRIEYPSAINLAKIAVDNMVDYLKSLPSYSEQHFSANYQILSYWAEIKQELNEL